MPAEAALPTHDQNRSPATLKAAFQTFNELSDDLARSYRELEGRFGELSRRLEAATDVSARLENLLAALPSAVVVLDRDATVVECNSAAVALLGAPLLAESWATIIQRCFIDPPTAGGWKWRCVN
jgi:two-component system sensor histidine kinase FlrB